tara:strand:+ start:325 stop:1749 length:1425 start_codon:yes stop_codon:yes gene_type:complete
MATTIQQHPLLLLTPVGLDTIFVVSNAPIVSTESRVKIIADVYISTTPIVIASSTPVGTFKTTPNNAGVGIFNFSPIIESFVSADNLAINESRFKFIKASARSFSMHLIDRFSVNDKTVRYLAIVFTTEYLDNDPLSSTFGDIILDNTSATSQEYLMYNGYVKATDELIFVDPNFAFNILSFNLSKTITAARYLTNAPMVQYATENDYGTISVAAIGNAALSLFRFIYTKTDGTTVTEDVDRTYSNGAYTAGNSNAISVFVFFGCYPANIRNTSPVFQALIAAGTLESYTVQGFNLSADTPPVEQTVTEILKINLLCPNLKGYEPIRLTWLNQFGTWDYYTFNMKSSKMISTKGTTYNQLEGTWNESTYRIDSFKGGKKSFRVNAKEKVTMNTDFVNEAESSWFEELINSPEVYILNGFKQDFLAAPASSLLNTYVIPVRLTTSSYTTKTVANDKLMQYTFEVEKSKTLRTQSV